LTEPRDSERGGGLSVERSRWLACLNCLVYPLLRNSRDPTKIRKSIRSQQLEGHRDHWTHRRCCKSACLHFHPRGWSKTPEHCEGTENVARLARLLVLCPQQVYVWYVYSWDRESVWVKKAKQDIEKLSLITGSTDVQC
jgi:hypothetical protein